MPTDRCRRPVRRRARPRGPQHPVTRDRTLRGEVALEHLVRRGARQRVEDAHVARPGLGGEVRLVGQERLEVCGRQRAAEHQCRHHLVADRLVGDGVHGRLLDRGVAQQDPLDRRGAEVLAVDAQPVGGAAGEVDEAVGVAVGQVAGPVHAAAHPLRLGVRVLVVARERARAGGVHQLAGRGLGVEQPPVGVELRVRRLRAASPGRAPSRPSSGRPRQPGGMSGTRCTITAFSVDE